MDDPSIPEAVHRQALAGLARLNALSGIASLLFGRLRRLQRRNPDRPLRVFDVASGAGDLPIKWLIAARKRRVPLQVTASDLSSQAIEYQQKSARQAGVELGEYQLDCLRDPIPGGFDVVICSLFMHHLEDHECSRLLQSMQMASEQTMLVCDLERSGFNLVSVGVASRLVTRSHVVHHDATASIRGAYTREEFKKLAEDSLALPVAVESLFPCRFLATVDYATVPELTPAFA